MNITKTMTLELTRGYEKTKIQYLSAKQGDNSSRFVKITLANSGEIYPVPKGVSANFRAQKPDGTMVLNQAVVNDDGTVTVELTQQTLAVCGDVIADIYLTDGSGSVLSSVSFVIQVEAAPMGDKTDSENEFLTLISLTERAEHAANTSTSASATAEKSAQQAETASTTAVESRARAETAAATATEASTSAGQSCTDAGNSAQVAGQAAQRAEAAKVGIVEAETAAKKSAETAVQAASDATSAASQAADKLPLAGGTMQGPLNMGGQALTGLAEPTKDGDAVPKKYVVPKTGGTFNGNVSVVGELGATKFQTKVSTADAGTVFDAVKKLYPTLNVGITLLDLTVSGSHFTLFVEKANNNYGSALQISYNGLVFYKLFNGQWSESPK